MLTTSYRIEIEQIAGSGDKAGFIDPVRVENYVADGADFGTYENHLDKERANYRYKLLIQSVQSMGNVYVSNVDTTGGSPLSPPDTLAFTLMAERGDGMLVTADETNEGVELEGIDALKRCVARSLLASRQNLMCDVFDSTKTLGDAIEPAARRGPRVINIDVGALVDDLEEAEAAITVIKL